MFAIECAENGSLYLACGCLAACQIVTFSMERALEVGQQQVDAFLVPRFQTIEGNGFQVAMHQVADRHIKCALRYGFEG